MKRASLTLPPTSLISVADDLTDRLLNPKSPKPKAKSKLQTTTPKPQTTESQAPVASIDNALALSHAAVAALRAAAQDSPARYSVAVKYRLDALAHHLAQIAEFMESVRHV